MREQGEPERVPGHEEPSAQLPEVDIRTLCYRGRAALERAGHVGHSLASQLGAGGDLRAAEPLIRELIDLVPLALDTAD